MKYLKSINENFKQEDYYEASMPFTGIEADPSDESDIEKELLKIAKEYKILATYDKKDLANPFNEVTFFGIKPNLLKLFGEVYGFDEDELDDQAILVDKSSLNDAQAGFIMSQNYTIE